MLKELQEFGLGEKEAKTYVATLELAKATAQQIASKANINRATAYVQLEQLKDRGLVTQLSVDGKTFFIAERPEKVEQLIEKEKADILFREKEFLKILPSLKAIFHAGKDRPDVRFYEGEEAVNAYRDEIVKEKHAYFFAIVPFLSPNPVIEEDVFESLLKRIDDYRFIQIADKRLEIIDKMDRKHKNFKSKYIPLKKLELSIEIVLFGNKILINNRKGKPVAVLIEHPVIAESFKVMFEAFWTMAE